MMKKRPLLFMILLLGCLTAYGKEYHVSVKGDDTYAGSADAPFKTIGRAAQCAYPGDVVTVHAGTYREWVNPPRGGESDTRRIVYRAAPGERVELKGSERITGWTKDRDGEGLWKVILPNSFFGDYNPYADLISGDWFYDRGRKHHTGEVFLNGKSLYEKETLEKVCDPQADSLLKDPVGSAYTWYCIEDGTHTTIWANFHAFNPNKELVEISVRKTCFYPEQPGVDYLTLQGFHISQAATQWAAPTAEQIGMVATHWNKGWIIEDNVISDSKCSGITLGKERKSGHNVWSEDRSKDGSLHYIEVTFNAVRNGWNKENVGSHIVRNNTIFNCEQTGICGSMGAAFSVIENNHIYDIWTKRQFDGAEIGGIKFHAAVDTRIDHNRIHTAGRGIWLDWMTQGTRVSANLLYDNDLEDIFLEVNHGPFLIDNNILGSAVNLVDESNGGAYVHNLFLGKILTIKEYQRYTPYFLPHSTEIAGLSIIPGGDNRFINNIFAPVKPENADKIKGTYGLSAYDKAVYPVQAAGNIYYNGASPFAADSTGLVLTDFDPAVRIVDGKNSVSLQISLKGINDVFTGIVTTAVLGCAKLPKQAFEQPDGSPLEVNTDFFGLPRDRLPKPGPFECVADREQKIKVW